MQSFITQFMFFPEKRWEGRPENWGLDPEEVFLETPSGARLNALWFPAGKPPEGREAVTLLLFHGNAGNISHRFFKTDPLVRKGFNVLLPDYRGYGKSSGRITGERDLYEDGASAMEWLLRVKRIPPERIVLYGESIGSAVALETALRYPVKAVILEGGMTSMVKLAAHHYPFAPAFLLKDFEFDGLRRIRELRSPVLILHGRRDSICPFRMAEEMFAAAAGPKEFFAVDGADHNDLAVVALGRYAETIRGFVDRLDPATPKPPAHS
jgi:fermentation-respiration switch protein FrsA (DUF1100 family)